VRSDGSRDRQAVALAGSPATTPDGYLAPGVVHQAITDPAGPFAVHLVTVTLSAPSTVDLAMALDVLPGLETTSSMARRQGATVAVNGDYADPDHAGRPINAFAKDGRLLQTPFLPGNNHAVDDREAAVFMGRPNVQVVAEVPRTGLVLPVAQVNRGAPAGDEVAMFTPEGVALERPPAAATSARLRATGPAAVRADGWAETAYTVEEVGQLGGPVPAGTVVLSTPPAGAAAADLAALEPGEEVTVAWSFAAWPGILDTSGGNPTLVRNGRVLAGNVDGTTPFHRRNPRTGVGATADGRLLLVTVDGRQPGHSVGMTLREFAELFVGLGAPVGHQPRRRRVDHHGPGRHGGQPRLRPPGTSGPDGRAGAGRPHPGGPAHPPPAGGPGPRGRPGRPADRPGGHRRRPRLDGRPARLAARA